MCRQAGAEPDPLQAAGPGWALPTACRARSPGDRPGDRRLRTAEAGARPAGSTHCCCGQRAEGLAVAVRRPVRKPPPCPDRDRRQSGQDRRHRQPGGCPEEGGGAPPSQGPRGAALGGDETDVGHGDSGGPGAAPRGWPGPGAAPGGRSGQNTAREAACGVAGARNNTQGGGDFKGPSGSPSLQLTLFPVVVSTLVSAPRRSNTDVLWTPGGKQGRHAAPAEWPLRAQTRLSTVQTREGTARPPGTAGTDGAQSGFRSVLAGQP